MELKLHPQGPSWVPIWPCMQVIITGVGMTWASPLLQSIP
jgi:hypothetical protein